VSCRAEVYEKASGKSRERVRLASRIMGRRKSGEGEASSTSDRSSHQRRRLAIKLTTLFLTLPLPRPRILCRCYEDEVPTTKHNPPQTQQCVQWTAECSRVAFSAMQERQGWTGTNSFHACFSVPNAFPEPSRSRSYAAVRRRRPINHLPLSATTPDYNARRDHGKGRDTSRLNQMVVSK